MIIRLTTFILSFGFITLLFPDVEQKKHIAPVEIKEKLSEYGLFDGDMALQLPAADVFPYKLNTPLFSDYAEKLRFVRLPKGEKAQYEPDNVFLFPVGTILVKTFYYPFDFRKPQKGRRIIETRLLIHQPDAWQALAYIWNDEQTEAFLEVAGDTKQVSWTHTNGKKINLDYVVPNVNQCKGCHNNNESMAPIGPTARQLNGVFDYATGSTNQLQYWQQHGLLSGLPTLDSVARAAVWNDPSTGSLDARARAWLDVNCAHCHSETGPAKTSGMFLRWNENNPTKLGVWKTPVAAGKGSGNLLYGIVPQKPEESILLFRIRSTDPSEMMPELGRKMTHAEGAELIEQWIKAMPN